MEELVETIFILVLAALVLIAIIAFLGGIALMNYRFFSFTFNLFSFNLFGRDIFRYSELFPKDITLAHESILARHFTFYRNLPAGYQKIFKSRLRKFMDSKKFETRKGLILTEEMKVLISACAVQLTFGLRNYKLPGFNRILIYPESYYSHITKKYHKGEANARGLVVFSWKDFKEGYNEPNDNLNLGLHEFAHALFIGFMRDTTNDINFLSYYDSWKESGDREFFKLRSGSSHYLRAYGGTNFMEFFSVCVEHFFETPNEFREKIPGLYQLLSKLFGQDPCKMLKH